MVVGRVTLLLLLLLLVLMLIMMGVGVRGMRGGVVGVTVRGWVQS